MEKNRMEIVGMVRRAGNAFRLAYILAGTAAWQEYTYNKDDCKGFFDHTNLPRCWINSQ